MASSTRIRLALLAASILAPLAHPLFIGGGLTILSQNELDAAPNDGTAAILIHQPSPYSAARVACSLLGEEPFSPEKAPFNATLNASLAYQSYLAIFPPDQHYWIAKLEEEDDRCRSIDATGRISELNCLADLPTLCTQSAPLSNTTFADNAANWRVTQGVNGTGTLMTGYRDYHTWKFRGIRYAKKPERFGYSSEPYLDQGEVLAVTPGADCSQPIGEVKNGSSEDCLFMNIWTTHLPRMAGANKTELKPVMLYLYGGGFTSGSGKNPNTDGTNLASRGDVVVASVNYRVGNLGFLAFNDGVHNGNYALSDMVTALEWVKTYIEYFGGDPKRVTVFGESAGAQATHILLGSPKAKGLFHRAIMQSDPQGYPKDGKFTWMNYDSLDRAYNTTKKVLNQTGCLSATDQVGCLSKLSGFELANLTTNVNGAVLDGNYLTAPWLIVNNTGQATNISIITGVNRDESGVLIDDYPTPNATFATYADKSLARYNLSPDFVPSLSTPSFAVFTNASQESIFNATNAISTGGEFTCFDQAKSFSGAKHSAFKAVYAYEFNRTYQTSGYTRPWCVPPKTPERPFGDPDKEYYKCHAGEQLVVFGNARRAGLPDRDGKDVPFMQLVVDYWAAFARTGDPNPDTGSMAVRGYKSTLQQVGTTGRWEAVNAENPTVRTLQWNGVQVPYGRRDQCRALGIPMDVLEKWGTS